MLTHYKNISKMCSKCQIIKPENCFHRCGDGLQNYCKDCRRSYQRVYMRQKYQDPIFYEKQLYRNSLNRITNKPAGHSNEKLGCPDCFYLEWLKFQKMEYELVTGVKITKVERDHVLPLKHFSDDPRCYEWINIRPIEQSENRSKSAKFENYDLYKNQLRKARHFIDNLIESGSLNDVEYSKLRGLISKRFSELEQ